MSTLAPPKKDVELEDPGAHELEFTDSDDHFSDASEGHQSKSSKQSTDDAAPKQPSSPVPPTRIERVDESSSYGEVPGADAYKMRLGDAVPDEIEVVPAGHSTRQTPEPPRSTEQEAELPGGEPIPVTVVEKVDLNHIDRADIPGTEANERHKADATPDVILEAPLSAREKLEVLQNSESSSEDDDISSKKLESVASPRHFSREQDINLNLLQDTIHEPNILQSVSQAEMIEESGKDDNDDNDDNDDDDDFGDFDDGSQLTVEGKSEARAESTRTDISSRSHDADILSSQQHSLPFLDFTKLKSATEIKAAMEPYMQTLFPAAVNRQPHVPEEMLPEGDTTTILTTERSQSLWSQLIAPPTNIQPPNWKKSHIRRKFLVSLGVPVDLDEILPASKMKKLVLPSMEGLDDQDLSRDEDNTVPANANTTTTSGGGKQRQRGDGSATGTKKQLHHLNASAARIIVSTTDAALHNRTEDELQAHVSELLDMQTKWRAALEYWEERRETAIGNKEAFEAVIENLVSHAKRVRK